MGLGWDWDGTGMGLEWDWNGTGMGLGWDWDGIGMGLGWDWDGTGMGLEWDWDGTEILTNRIEWDSKFVYFKFSDEQNFILFTNTIFKLTFYKK
jgi:hypothetical protein